MSGLVGYDSSDGEEEKCDDNEQLTTTQSKHNKSTLSPTNDFLGNHSTSAHDEPKTPNLLTANARLVGPFGPSPNVASKDDTRSASQSPYSANRSLLHDLTLPTHVNLDIPSSPSGSPPPGMDQKFEHFLEIKKQGIHFNEKLARSTALKNPSLLEKLMTFAGLEQVDQYATTLSTSVWDPQGFPQSAYKEKLAETQQAISKRKEENKSQLQRESIDFIPCTRSGPLLSRESSFSDLRSKGLRVSAAERVMAGLDKERTKS